MADGHRPVTRAAFQSRFADAVESCKAVTIILSVASEIMNTHIEDFQRGVVVDQMSMERHGIRGGEDQTQAQSSNQNSVQSPTASSQNQNHTTGGMKTHQLLSMVVAVV